MIKKVVAKVFGTKHEREMKRLRPVVEQINALEPAMQALSDAALRAKTEEFRKRIQERIETAVGLPTGVAAGSANGTDSGASDQERRQRLTDVALRDTMQEILPEAFAVVREAGQRALGMRHYDVQMIGGMVLHTGKIAEMKTGEGKTLVATLPVYLNALSGRGVHVVTVNDYLAKRDAEWMGKLYSFLGMTVGVIVHDLSDDQRREAYGSDITYGTNNEYGFDYLRDNMKFDLKDCVQRGHFFAIVDEVDSILIDEARTPLIISGSSEESTDKYAKANTLVPRLERGEEIEKLEERILTGDYAVDEKRKTITVTEQGWEKIEKMLGIDNIADPENWDWKHHVETAIKAHSLYRLDVEYVVKDGEVIIVDEFTGRLMPGRRWSDGLHQAVEAKEGVKIERENQTLATITFQNYFRMYRKLAGMTGTAETEAPEFLKIYNLQVSVIPTNVVMRRLENPDVVFRTEKEKYFSVSDEIQKMNAEGRPVLVGTTSIEKSERLSEILKKKGVKHVVLNAKYHEREAEIVAQAGRKAVVTIATNMAGRGTDILLGGNPEFMARQEAVKKGLAQPIDELVPRNIDGAMTYFYYQGQEFQAPVKEWEQIFGQFKTGTDAEHEEVVRVGGLHIVGTERHESRRIDNQLRGRAGRQGDPGSSRFYLALEDDLMRIFAKEWVSNLLQRLGMEEGVPIESGMISRRIEKAQEAVEGQNFESRKHLLEYDDVMNKQREAVYGLRRQLLEGVEQKELILEDYVHGSLGDAIAAQMPENVHPDEWNFPEFARELQGRFGLDTTSELETFEKMGRHEIGETIFERLKLKYEEKETLLGTEAMRYHERMMMLSVLDQLWKEHLLNLDHLKEGINLRGYGQKDPLVEYKRESFDLFEGMMMRFQQDLVRLLLTMQIIERGGGEEPGEEPGGPVPVGGPSTPRLSGGGAARRPRTTLDDLEREFQRKKQKELEQAQLAGADMSASDVTQVRRAENKVGRNDPCPCGSGKKYKKCHGA